jgi:hypothetical protein
MKKLLLLVCLVGLAVFAAPKFFSAEDYYQITDAIKRINAPDFKWSLRSIEPWDQATVIRDYERRGYKLQCYGPRVEEKISREEDYQCSAIIKSAFNIPAKYVTFSFKNQKLWHVRLEFKEKSYSALQKYLDVTMADEVRLDMQPSANFGADIYGKPLVVWGTRYGVITTSGFTANQTNTVLWTNLRWY